jgi:quinolinate synthase
MLRMSVDSIKKFGFINNGVDESLDLGSEIKRLCHEKNAIILAHYYQNEEIQDIADFIGDSLALSQKAEKTDAKIILFAGVNFMAETAKIICPDKKVLLPDLNAGCSLADSCPPDEFELFIKKHPDHVVITYINSDIRVKALSDIICTSSNAVDIVNSVPEEKGIIFAPDKNLGNYIKSKVNRKNMVIWEGACHVHEEFSLERILEIKKFHPKAKILAHPECKKHILLISDFIGSTSALLDYTKKDTNNEYIVATESGIIHQMKLAHPEKEFIPAPPIDSTCGCNDCRFMKLISLKKLYNCIKYELPEIILDEELRIKAEIPIKRMLQLSEKFNK